ncbi:hypothetical protein QMA04_00345 [Planococcus sp. APC 3900]|uniref:hypothetical protein n=1 Tax=Planococcus sp. APC 3900 TaxID=3035191 RepID=UPI0025B41482|nr:hypothetical protein [Planococcus sp. APC 3900]MDN3436514.1 hypothetical protein [Planococcus sp. APC 3900]
MDVVLPIGTKHGCFTIIGGSEEYYEKFSKIRIERLELDKQKFINGEKIPDNNFESVDTFDKWIQDCMSQKKYKCQCKCGRIVYLNEKGLFFKRWRDCEGLGEIGEQKNCGLKHERINKRLASYPRVKDESYHIDYSNTIHESLEILDCINENYEGKPITHDKRKKGSGKFIVYKLYKCRCYMCGKDYEFKSSDFEIKIDKYGSRASDGYYCNAFCDCHNISSFQWRTIKILREHNIKYKVEVVFPDLFGVGQKQLLRYDFAVLGSDKSIKCLIECQGEQHYKPVAEFGGASQFESQVKNDELKRFYAKTHNIPLFEIPYTCNSYDKEIKFLKTAGII